MIKTALCFLAPLLLAASVVTGAASAADDGSASAGSAVLIEPMGAGDAGSASAPEAGSGSAAPAVTKIPDPVKDPGGALEELNKLYKNGAFAGLFYLLGFFALVYAERKIKWLSTGYRKVAVASLLYGAGMLAERAISGTTPNASMIVGALTASPVFAFKAVGPKPTTSAVA